ncbi:MAG: nucleotidyltransferase family protein [Hydrogenophaga sp.]|nr:nucleotidyltransferase family protein [Hydrogenophaga sp.]
MAPDRQRLARWISGKERPAGAWTADDQIDSTLSLAREEGVIGLLDFRLREHSTAVATNDTGEKWLLALKEAARTEALRSMMLEGETRRVLKLLDGLGIEALLLKGTALAYWAYPEPHLRASGDVDVLVPDRADAERLAQALADHGYAREETSGDLVAHELMCTRRMSPQWVLEVDVHWRLNNTTLFAHLFDFDELMTGSIPVPRLAPNARGLGPVDALLHAAVHRARNLANGVGDALKWLYDLVVLSERMRDSDWAELVEKASRKQLAGVTLGALASAEAMFGCAVPEGVRRDLRLAAATEPLDVNRLEDWRYMQLQNFRSVRGWWPRLRWLWQRLFPSGDDMRQMYGREGSYLALLQVRAQRFWVKWRQR